MRSLGIAILIAASTTATAVRAWADAPFKTGLEVSVELGAGNLFDPSRNAYLKYQNNPATVPTAYDTGFGAHAWLGYRVAPTVALALDYAYLSPGTDIQTFNMQSVDVVHHFVAPSLRFYLTPHKRWIDSWLQFGIGYFKFDVTDHATSPASTMTVDGVGIGFGVGIDVNVVSTSFGRLSVGPTAGFSVDVGLNCDHTGGFKCFQSGSSDPSMDVNGTWFAALSLRYTIFTSIPPPPPPPPKIEFVLVRSKLQFQTNEGMKPEVVPTREYTAALPNVHVVALRAPSSCLKQTAADATGKAARQGEAVLQTECGVQMAEIERTLTQHQFVVRSWDAILTMERDGGMTPIQAAQRLGAQVLFQVNSLERVNAEPGRDARWERNFFRSDASGAQLEPMKLTSTEIAQLRGIVAPKERVALATLSQGAMLDLSAILVDTGQTIWFYRWRHLHTTGEDLAHTTLVRRIDATPFQEVAPQRANEAAAPIAEQQSSADVEQYSAGGSPTSIAEARYFKLLHETVKDFVEQFLGGEGSALTPPASPAATPSCPEGEVIGPSTAGKCCWPAQSWSESQHACVGKPTCPAGRLTVGDSCK